MAFSHPSYICTYSIIHALFECECVLYCRIAGKQNFFLLASAISNSVTLSILYVLPKQLRPPRKRLLFNCGPARESPLQLRPPRKRVLFNCGPARESPLQLRPPQNRVLFNFGLRETESSSTAASAKQSPLQLRPPRNRVLLNCGLQCFVL